MSVTLKNIEDDIMNLLTKFQVTDESRISRRWMFNKINQVRADRICEQYKNTEIIDRNWFSNLSLVQFHTINAADDASITACGCDTISKAYIPQFVTLPTKTINQDLGIQSITSICGKVNYYNKPMSSWNLITSENPLSLFSYYDRVNTALYINKKVTQLRITGILYDPADGFYINSAPIASGSIVSGVLYIVKGGQVAYNSTMYNDGAIFTGAAATTYTGAGKVYLDEQNIAYIETYPYPVNGDMARDIAIEICTKEFGIEKGQLTDNTNDSKDDIQKGQG